MFIAITHWSDGRSLVSATLSVLDPDALQNSSRMSCCCRVSWRSGSFASAGAAPPHAPAALRWGRCWGVPAQKSWIWTWVVAEQVSLPTLLHLYHEGQLSWWSQEKGRTSSPVLTDHVIRASSSIYPCHKGQFSNTALVGQGQTNSVPKLARGRAGSPTLSLGGEWRG